MQSTILKIVAIYEYLVNFPKIGILVEMYVTFPTNYKFAFVNNCLIFYRIEDDIGYIQGEIL